MEVRPIDANKLKEALKCGAYSSVLKLIDRQPTLDYEPVVHCKDCEYSIRLKDDTYCTKKAKTEFDINTGAQNWLGLFKVKENRFCSYGAKMDEEQK